MRKAGAEIYCPSQAAVGIISGKWSACDPKQTVVVRSNPGIFVHLTMKTLLVALFLYASIGHAEEDCTFSSQGILENIKRIASRIPGGSVDSESVSAKWVHENGDLDFYSESGCYDLGGAVGRVSQMSEPRSSDSVRYVVLELAERFLPDSEAKRISSAFESGSYESGKSDSGEFILIPHPFGEITITHRFVDGSDAVEIAWPIL